MTEKLNSDAAGVLGWKNAVSGHDPYLPTITLGVGASINVTAEQLAEGFWSLGSDQMADFFAELDRLAGWAFKWPSWSKKLLSAQAPRTTITAQ